MKDVMIQYFQWYLPSDGRHWINIKNNAKNLKDSGFSAVWLPPAYKGQGGKDDVGYGVYDLYDLGEFDQKGTVATKYGTIDEYLEAINALHQNKIKVYGDMVLNHRMGGDGTEMVTVVENKQQDRNCLISDKKIIEAWTRFDFTNRNGKYSTFKWNQDCFDGVDFDERTKQHGIYEFDGESWEQQVDFEYGNYDYLMGADVDFSNPIVVDELIKYGKWYLDTTNVDGFRIDAVKHIDFTFFDRWLGILREYKDDELFAVGEYWHGDVKALQNYLRVSNNCMSLFDVPLHFKFHQASNDSGNFDMGSLLEGTLVKENQFNAVTFVENHDSQAGQSLQSVVANWFKPLAYAIILLRSQGYPCVFYGDYYGIEEFDVPSFKEIIDLMIKIRHEKLFGFQHDYFDHYNVVGWSYEGDDDHENSGFAVLLSDGPEGIKVMDVGKRNSGKEYIDVTNNIKDIVVIDENGLGCFKVTGGSVSIWIIK